VVCRNVRTGGGYGGPREVFEEGLIEIGENLLVKKKKESNRKEVYQGKRSLTTRGRGKDKLY